MIVPLVGKEILNLQFERVGLMPQLLGHLIARHRLCHQIGAQSVVLHLSVETLLGSSTLLDVGHLVGRVVRGSLELRTLSQHSGGYHSARIAQTTDVRLLGETIDTKVNLGVGARLTVNLLYGVLKYHLVILSRHSC